MDHEVSVYREPGTRFRVFQAGYLMQSSWQVCDVGADSIQPPKSSEPTPSINASYRQNFPLWGLFPWRTLTNVCPRCQIFCLVFRHNPHSQWLNSFQVTPTFPHLTLIQCERQVWVEITVICLWSHIKDLANYPKDNGKLVVHFSRKIVRLGLHCSKIYIKKINKTSLEWLGWSVSRAATGSSCKRSRKEWFPGLEQGQGKEVERFYRTWWMSRDGEGAGSQDDFWARGEERVQMVTLWCLSIPCQIKCNHFTLGLKASVRWPQTTQT